MFLGIKIFWALLRAHFSLTARAKMSLWVGPKTYAREHNSIGLLISKRAWWFVGKGDKIYTNREAIKLFKILILPIKLNFQYYQELRQLFTLINFFSNLIA